MSKKKHVGEVPGKVSSKSAGLTLTHYLVPVS